MRLLVYIILIAALIVTAAAPDVGAECVVTLRPESQVQSLTPIKIADVGIIESSGELGRTIEEITIGTGPLPGTQRTISTDYVRLKLKAAASGEDLTVVGPEKISVVGRCIRISSDELSEEARSFALRQLPSDHKTYDVVVERSPREMVLPDNSGIVIQPRMLSQTMRLGPNTVALDAVLDGRVITTTSASVQVRATADVLVVTRPIAQGESITSSNTRWEPREVTKLPRAIVMTEGEKIADWVARRSLSAGSVVTDYDVELPPDVTRGDTVTLVVRCGAVTLRTTAEARQAGRTGDSISVRPSVSKEDVRARIMEPGLVEITR